MLFRWISLQCCQLFSISNHFYFSSDYIFELILLDSGNCGVLNQSDYGLVLIKKNCFQKSYIIFYDSEINWIIINSNNSHEMNLQEKKIN